jgi:hypothetical protein
MHVLLGLLFVVLLGYLFYRFVLTPAAAPFTHAALESERAREKHSWKQGTRFNIASGGGMRRFDQADKPLLATSVVFEAPGSLPYFLKETKL